MEDETDPEKVAGFGTKLFWLVEEDGLRNGNVQFSWLSFLFLTRSPSSEFLSSDSDELEKISHFCNGVIEPSMGLGLMMGYLLVPGCQLLLVHPSLLPKRRRNAWSD
ncbi:hypothetical protein EV2_040926 [Malus domestica]